MFICNLTVTIFLSVYLSIYLSFWLAIFLSICLSTYLSIYVHKFVGTQLLNVLEGLGVKGSVAGSVFQDFMRIYALWLQGLGFWGSGFWV